jgi:hypothetical protein
MGRCYTHVRPAGGGYAGDVATVDIPLNHLRAGAGETADARFSR